MKKELTWLIIGFITFGIGLSLEIYNQSTETKNLKTETYKTEAVSTNTEENKTENENNKTTTNTQDATTNNNICTNPKKSSSTTKVTDSDITTKEQNSDSENNKESTNSQFNEDTSSEENITIVEVDTQYSNNENNSLDSSSEEDISAIIEESEEITESITSDNQITADEQNTKSEVNSNENISNKEITTATTETNNNDTNVDNDTNSNNTVETTSTTKEETTQQNTSSNSTMKTSKYITLNKTIKYLEYKSSFQLKVTLKNISGNVTWTSSNSNIAKVDSNGKVTATGGGVAIITASVNGEATSCKVIAIRNSFKTLTAPWRTTATIYYDGNKKITYYFRRQNYKYACSSEKVNGKEICTSGFKTWYANHGCATISTTAVVNAYKGRTQNNLISSTKMRMVYEKNEYSWKSKYSSDPYCNLSENLNQLTRDRVAAVLNNQFKLSATAYTIASTKGNEAHIERITNALAEGRPVIIFVNANQAGTKKFTSGVHTLTMVGFADDEGHVLVLDSSHNGFKEDTVEKMVNQYIGRGTGKYKGYIVLNEKKA